MTTPSTILPGDLASRHEEPGSYLPPEVTYDVPHHSWTLTETWWCRVDHTIIRIPAGFSFDLASIPRVLWWLLAPNELGIAPPLAHDFLYQNRGVVTDPFDRVFTRREVDRLFRQLMGEEQVWWWRRWAAWAAVRAFGWLAWNSRG
jgi:hypothetical protein